MDNDFRCDSMTKYAGDPFSIDALLVSAFDYQRARSRIISDIKSDFILAPHLSAVFVHCFDELEEQLRHDLTTSGFSPSLPITINVPKSNRTPFTGSRRRGVNYVRPGSILFPIDRLLYQIFADETADIVEHKIDRDRCFSHPVSADAGSKMFQASRLSWHKFRSRIAAHSSSCELVLKADIASYFNNINQHTLVNHLTHVGLDDQLTKPLEEFLLRLTGERSSRGIIQGVFPSDLFGTFYLSSVDTFLSDRDIPSARYVDDIYVFFNNFDEAEQLFVRLLRELQSLGLYLNEAKSRFSLPGVLIAEEPDLERKFEEAAQEIEEVSKEIGIDFVETDYGFQAIWADEDDDESQDKQEYELLATETLFDEIADFPKSAEEIIRFCLPMFSKFESGYGLHYVLENFDQEPSLAQIFCNYLSEFLYDEEVRSRLESRIMERKPKFEWEYIWLFGALLKGDEASDKLVKSAIELLADQRGPDPMRAMAAIFAGRFGSFNRRRQLRDHYANEGSHFVQTAMLFATRWYERTERNTALASWSSHSPLHRLVGSCVRVLA